MRWVIWLALAGLLLTVTTPGALGCSYAPKMHPDDGIAPDFLDMYSSSTNVGWNWVYVDVPGERVVAKGGYWASDDASYSFGPGTGKLSGYTLMANEVENPGWCDAKRTGARLEGPDETVATWPDAKYYWTLDGFYVTESIAEGIEFRSTDAPGEAVHLQSPLFAGHDGRIHGINLVDYYGIGTIGSDSLLIFGNQSIASVQLPWTLGNGMQTVRGPGDTYMVTTQDRWFVVNPSEARLEAHGTFDEVSRKGDVWSYSLGSSLFQLARDGSIMHEVDLGSKIVGFTQRDGAFLVGTLDGAWAIPAIPEGMGPTPVRVYLDVLWTETPEEADSLEGTTYSFSELEALHLASKQEVGLPEGNASIAPTTGEEPGPKDSPFALPVLVAVGLLVVARRRRRE